MQGEHSEDTLRAHVTPPTPQQKSRKRHERRHSAAKRSLARPKKSRPSTVHSAPAFAPHSPPISPPLLESSLGLPAVPSTPEVTEEADEADIDDQVCSRGFPK